MHVEADVHLFHSPAGKKQVCLYILFSRKHEKTLVWVLYMYLYYVFLESFEVIQAIKIFTVLWSFWYQIHLHLWIIDRVWG